MSNKVQIFAFSGKLGSGKDYISNITKSMLSDRNDIITLSLADHLKIDVIGKDNVEFEKVFYEKDSETRKLLQKRGTEEGRNVYGHDVWVKILLSWIKLFISRGADKFIIPDVRFKNEIDILTLFCKMNDICLTLIRITSPKRNLQRLEKESNGDPKIFEQISTHVSETELDNYFHFDLELKNDPGDDFITPLRDYILLLKKGQDSV